MWFEVGCLHGKLVILPRSRTLLINMVTVFFLNENNGFQSLPPKIFFRLVHSLYERFPSCINGITLIRHLTALVV